MTRPVASATLLVLAASHLLATMAQDSPATEAARLALVEALGPASEAPSAEVLPAALAVNVVTLGAPQKVILHPAAGVVNTDGTHAVFEYWPTPNKLYWKLTIFSIKGFIGAHLHYDPSGQANGTIYVDLAPRDATFLPDADAKNYLAKTFNGDFGDGGFVTSAYNGDYDGFLELIRRGAIYINVHNLAYRGGLVQAYLPSAA